MGKSLNEIAEDLRKSEKKVQLVYAFNGVGKTRLSREFKKLVVPETEDSDEVTPIKILYYNAFTEDLFHWENNPDANRLIIRPNNFTKWVLKEQGQENNIIKLFQHYTSDKLTPIFNEDYSEITFSIKTGDENSIDDIKISKGEESCLIWCVFFSIVRQAIGVLKEHAEPEERETNLFDALEYIFIDDPVSSLDENHLIELAVNIANLVNEGKKVGLKFVFTTHNPLFYNVLYNELNLNSDNSAKNGYCCFLLKKMDDGSFELESKKGDSNKAFSYHIHI